MRWLANSILIVLSLVAVFFISIFSVDYGVVGNVVLDPDFTSETSCGAGYYQDLWNSTMRVLSNGGEVPEYTDAIASTASTTYDGRCTGFDIYNLTFETNGNITMYYLYVTHDGEDPNILAGMLFIDDSDGGFVFPSDASGRASALYGKIPTRSKFERGDGAAQTNPGGELSKFINLPGSLGAWTQPGAGDTDNNAFITFFNSSVSGGYNSSNAFYVHRDYNITYISFSKVREPFLNKKSYYIGNFSLNEDTSKSNAISLRDVFDWSGSVTFGFNTDNSNAVDLVFDSNFNVTIQPKANWNGNVKVNITVNQTDLGVEEQSNDFYITVASVSDAPVIFDDFPSKLTWHFNQNRSFTLTEHFSDPDGDAMNFSATSMSHINSVIDDDEITFLPDNNWKGSEDVVITANDSVLATSSDNITLVVTDLTGGGNSAPTIVSKSPLSTTITMDKATSRIFSVSATDPQNDTLTYSWTVNSIAVQSSTNQYTFVGDEEGSFVIKVLVSDGFFDKSAQWSVVVVKAGSDDDDTDTSSESSGNVQVNVREKSSLGRNIFLIVGIVVIIAVLIGGVFFMIHLSKKNKKVGTVVKSSPLQKKQVSTAQQKKPKQGYFESLNFDELTPLVNFIKRYKSRGYSNTAIKQSLSKKGWKPKQIEEAFKRAGF